MHFQAHLDYCLDTVPSSMRSVLLGWLSVEDISQQPVATLNTSPVVPASSETAVMHRNLPKLQVSLAFPFVTIEALFS